MVESIPPVSRNSHAARAESVAPTTRYPDALPAAVFAGVPGIEWGDVLNNWTFALLGNLVGAGVFVAGAYWYLFGRSAEPAPAAAPSPARETPRPARSPVSPAGV